MTDIPATSDARLLHFRDPRQPQDIQFEIERDHMVLLRPELQAGTLTFSADSRINGAPYRLVLRFEAALNDANCYSLLIEISWRDQSADSQAYHRRSAPGWFDLWLHRYAASNPAPRRGAASERYDRLVQACLAAEQHLADVPALQRAVLDGLRQGGVYSTAHKEGGSRIYAAGSSFVHSTFGDNESLDRFDDEAKFLAFLRQQYDWQTSRSIYPEKVDEYTAWKLILRLQERSSDGHRTPVRPRTPLFGGNATPGRRPKLRTVVVWIAILGALAMTYASNPFQVATLGTPIGPAAASADHIALLIVTQTPYMPSLHRDASKDRYDVSLLVHERRASGQKQLVQVLRNLDASRSQNAARMLGYDGRIFWFLADDIAGYDPKAKRLVRIDDLRRANPGLDALWPVGFYELDDKLVVSTRDNRIIVEIDPQTLAARQLDQPPRRRRPFPPHPATALLASTSPPSLGLLDAAYVRERVDASPLILSNPDSRLVTYWRKIPNLQRMLYVARIDSQGTTLWEAETGIGDLHQVLPDRDTLALIGTRPRIPDKVPEPILAVMRNDRGDITQHSLWIRH